MDSFEELVIRDLPAVEEALSKQDNNSIVKKLRIEHDPIGDSNSTVARTPSPRPYHKNIIATGSENELLDLEVGSDKSVDGNSNKTPISICRGETRNDLIRNECLADIFEGTVSQFPDKPAAIFGDLQVTYKELSLRADLLAHHLIENGAKPGQIIGLWMPRGLELLISQVAIAKTGCAWLPMDIDAPADRVVVCMQDSSSIGVMVWNDEYALKLTTAGLTGIPLHQVSVLESRLKEQNIQEPLRRNRSLQKGDDPSYVIYTSGSTGKPKGIVLTQQSICHFLRSENEFLQIKNTDITYQGFSVAFDMSFEEIWISYLAGATLWVAPKMLTSDPESLPVALEKAGVTVLHVVPTLLALFAKDVDSIRLINVGGEACPESIVERFSRSGRQIFNTYGPSEATVSASLAELKFGEKVTIGRPLPNYNLLVIDPVTCAIVNVGETGELCITGPGLANGYLGRPDLTSQKFINLPALDGERTYRTGDLARIDETGQVHCLGRTDDQVKIRGFRVELGEIESVICEQPTVGTGAVLLIKLNGIDQLVAFIVPKDESSAGQAFDIPTIKKVLQVKLPTYMVPSRFEIMEVMPRLTSGKIDRHALRAYANSLKAQANNNESYVPQNEVETTLFNALNSLFPGQKITLNDNFFNDLGGHSLFAAKLLGEIRKDTKYSHMTVQKLYQAKTIQDIINDMACVDKDGKQIKHVGFVPSVKVGEPRPKHIWLSIYICGFFQLLAWPFLVVEKTSAGFASFFVFLVYWEQETSQLPEAIAVSVGVGFGLIFFFLMYTIIMFRIVTFGLKPGKYPLWGVTYFRFWLAEHFIMAAPVNLFADTPLINLFYRCLGAKIGREAHFHGVARFPKFVEVGEFSSIGSQAVVDNAYVENGWLYLTRAKIGNHVSVGGYAVLHGNVVIEDYGKILGQSSLLEGNTIKKYEVWDGSPAKFVKHRPHFESPKPISYVHACAENFLFVLLASIISILFQLPTIPALGIVSAISDEIWGLDAMKTTIDEHHDAGTEFITALGFFGISLPVSTLLIILSLLFAFTVRRILVFRRIREGIHSVHSVEYFRLFVLQQILSNSLASLNGIFATIFTSTFFWCLGMRVGKKVEISVTSGMNPDLVELKDGSFMADMCFLGDNVYEGDATINLRKTTVGERTFFGNSGYTVNGKDIPSNIMIGVQSKVPETEGFVMESGHTYVGSPAILLPRRDNKLNKFPDHLTFNPSIWRYVARGMVEYWRIVLPTVVGIGFSFNFLFFAVPYYYEGNWPVFALAFLLTELFYTIFCFLFIVVIKWVFIGRYRPSEAPIWTLYVWIADSVTTLEQYFGQQMWLSYWVGTPFAAMMWRCYGAKIGKGCYINSWLMTEFDCATIGDFCEFNYFAFPQTHLFEDRIFKVGKITIGNNVTCHARTAILFDSVIGDNVEIGPLSLVMKGEVIPPNTRWQGAPTAPWVETVSESNNNNNNNGDAPSAPAAATSIIGLNNKGSVIAAAPIKKDEVSNV